ncbi:MAG: sn-glycerol-3-phosphate ABC transporter ATP-binding protein UgpC [Bacteroidota bacterium]|nr:sn-glycerol-3-phosphate ABC transporter ATP-binding protein UgpC [Bacteroidota bacterium]MDE2958079.1 sn-glycerol-3-phosphate ABC transporter ATP-binding protein UgpC [Bacteroidota bacterium]
MASVTLKNVSKTYENGQEAVREASFTVNDGEFMVLVGPSGCGKSTTLRMLAGLESVTAGTIAIDGDVVNDMPPKDRDVAMVFQNYALYPHMSVFDNMAFGLKLRKYSKRQIQERVHQAAETLGLTEILKRKPKQLSGGQQQRVAVGRAIVRKPKVFLFDEPLSNLDAKLRVQMRAEIARLHRDLAATMVYVTHDQTEAMTLGDRIVVMKDGVVQQIDAPLALYRRPANLFVGGFIGNPAMNFIEGTLTGADQIFESSSGSVRIRIEGRGDDQVRPVTAGIRPESLKLIGNASDADIRAERLLVEHLGAETLIHARTGTDPFIARVKAEEATDLGTTLHFRLGPEDVHLFDTDTGQAWPSADPDVTGGVKGA